MYHFNLLADKHQKQTKRWIIFKHIANGVVFLNGILVVIAGMIIGANIILSSRLAEANNDAAQQLERVSASDRLVQDVSGLNTRIDSLSRIQSDHAQYLALIESFEEIIPASISISSVTIDFSEESIRVAGIAESRDALKNIQSAIDSSERFSMIDVPFGEFTQSSQIPFQLNLTFRISDFGF